MEGNKMDAFQVPLFLTRDRITEVASSWEGTPYVHQQKRKGAGCDCLGLIRGVYEELYGAEPEKPPPYNANWAEMQGKELMLEAATRNLVAVPKTPLKPGQVLVFRIVPKGIAKHAAIYVGDSQIIHAYSNHDVCRTDIPDAWVPRIAGVFDFPGVID
jgi:NlpC/P60 family putative phage cell wall peptidase